MQPILQSKEVSRYNYWAGTVIGFLCSMFLLVDGAAKIAMIDPVREAIMKLGYPGSVTPQTGILLIVCTLIYMIPRTSIFGAILLTGYLGGATAIHVRAGDAFIFPVLFGVFLWGALYIRDPQLQKLIPLRR